MEGAFSEWVSEGGGDFSGWESEGGGDFSGWESEGGGDFSGWVSEGGFSGWESEGGAFSESCTQKKYAIVNKTHCKHVLFEIYRHLSLVIEKYTTQTTYILCPCDIFFESCNVGLFLQHHSSLVGQLIQALSKISVDGIWP